MFILAFISLLSFLTSLYLCSVIYYKCFCIVWLFTVWSLQYHKVPIFCAIHISYERPIKKEISYIIFVYSCCVLYYIMNMHAAKPILAIEYICQESYLRAGAAACFHSQSSLCHALFYSCDLSTRLSSARKVINLFSAPLRWVYFKLVL